MRNFLLGLGEDVISTSHVLQANVTRSPVSENRNN